MTTQHDRTLDCTGLYCPEPVFRVRLELDDMEPRQTIKVTADDPTAEQDIKKHHLSCGRDQSPAEEYLDEELIEDIQSGDISPRKLQCKLQGKREIVWCTFAEAIDDEWQKSKSPDQIRDMLGLWDEKFHSSAYIVEFRYKKPGGALRFPTVIEAGSNPAFSPSSSGEKTDLTRHTQTLEPGFPEAVHKPIPANTVDELIVRGQLKTEPEPFWQRITNSSITPTES